MNSYGETWKKYRKSWPKMVERFSSFLFKGFQMKRKANFSLIKQFSASREPLVQTVIKKVKPMTLPEY